MFNRNKMKKTSSQTIASIRENTNHQAINKKAVTNGKQKKNQATTIAIKNPTMKTLQPKNPSNNNSNQKPNHENLTTKKANPQSTISQQNQK